MNKTIFITGTSTGLGKETALYFAQKGWNVIATMRNPSAHQHFDGVPNITLYKLDITNKAQIESVISEIIKNNTVDVVFNNAGYGLIGPFEATTDEQILQQINTNILGGMRITKAFIPHFRERGSGVFLNATSIAGHSAFPLFSAYHASKWALEGWSESLAYELEHFGIAVKILVPGRINTDFDGRSLVVTNHPAYHDFIKQVESVYNQPKRLKNQSTTDQVVKVIYGAATDGKNKLRYIVGSDAKLIFTLRRWLGHKLFIKIVNWIFLKKFKF